MFRLWRIGDNKKLNDVIEVKTIFAHLLNKYS